MNTHEMQVAWKSPLNNLPGSEHEKLASKFTGQMIRRRRFQSIWLINTFVWLTLITVVAVWTVIEGRISPAHGTHLAREWGLVPLLLVPWIFAIHFLRQYLSTGITARGDSSIVDSLRAALHSNRAEQARLKLVGVLFLIMVPLLAVSMQQLHGAHKATPRELLCMGVLFGVALSLSAAGIAARYFFRLIPQQRQITSALAELSE